MTALLVIDDLRRRFGDRDVLDGLDLQVGAGERCALVGPNGVGKSTVLRCVAGTLAPTGGTVRVDGHEAGTIAARRRLGVSLSQERSFYLRLSGRTNLEFFASLRGFGRRDGARAVAELSSELQLDDFLDERTDTYSTGMILRLAFARSLLGDPPLLVLDEPTRSLDRASTASLWDALDRRRATAVLIATHVEHDLDHCDTTVELHP